MSTLKVDAIRHNSATSDAITTASDGTCTAKLTSVAGGQLSNRNIFVNGAMMVAQRGVTSTTANAYSTVDRVQIRTSGVDEAPTQAQVDVASGTTPFTLGFRKALRLTNGNQTSGAGTSDYIWWDYRLESQDMANSGWNYTSSSSFITFSFWIKSSVAQTFKGYFRTIDGTSQQYPFETGSLSADTWTKVTKTIPGNSNISFDNDSALGFQINIFAFYGTDVTDNSVTENAWSAFASSARMKDNTSTWYTTNDATLEMTGFQLEVGDTATTFEHRSYGDELARCQRYYEKIPISINEIFHFNVNQFGSSGAIRFPFKVSKRAVPGSVSIDAASFDYYKVAGSGSNGQGNFTVTSFTTEAMEIKSAGAAANGVFWCHKTATGYIDASSDL